MVRGEGMEAGGEGWTRKQGLDEEAEKVRGARMGRKQGWLRFKKEPWGSLRKMIVLFLETLSLFWIVETFEEII